MIGRESELRLVESFLDDSGPADRLSMSVHTVEAHLSAVFQATGIRSRAEVAAALGEVGAEPRDSPAETRDSPSS
jgi:DNA-binding NarL/FixJ family response regulator